MINRDHDHTFWARHHHRGIGTVDNRPKFQEERPSEDAIVHDFKAGHLKYKHLLTLVVSCSIGHH
jgi:hypothetical protein